MKKFFVILSVALLLIGQSLSIQKSELMIGADDDLIEIHSVKPELMIGADDDLIEIHSVKPV